MTAGACFIWHAVCVIEFRNRKAQGAPCDFGAAWPIDQAGDSSMKSNRRADSARVPIRSTIVIANGGRIPAAGFERAPSREPSGAGLHRADDGFPVATASFG